MRFHHGLRAVCGAAALFAASSASASINFSGSLSATSAGAPSAACAPLPFTSTVLPINSTGTSSLGNFTYGSTSCIAGAAGGPIVGTFFMIFADGQIQGTTTGASSPTATVGLSDLTINYLITGGTGLFAGATGNLTGVGTVDIRTPPSRLNLTINGVITPVPEPGTWATMILGVGAIGWSMRRRGQMRLAARIV